MKWKLCTNFVFLFVTDFNLCDLLVFINTYPSSLNAGAGPGPSSLTPTTGRCGWWATAPTTTESGFGIPPFQLFADQPLHLFSLRFVGVSIRLKLHMKRKISRITTFKFLLLFLLCANETAAKKNTRCTTYVNNKLDYLCDTIQDLAHSFSAFRFGSLHCF